jgi:hypothetical protein
MHVLLVWMGVDGDGDVDASVEDFADCRNVE